MTPPFVALLRARASELVIPVSRVLRSVGRESKERFQSFRSRGAKKTASNLVMSGALAFSLAVTPAAKVQAQDMERAVGALLGAIIGSAIRERQRQHTNQSRQQRTQPVRPAITQAQRHEIREVQTALNFFGFPAGAVDGLMGPNTRGAIRTYQQAMGFQSTGRLLDQERAFLLECYRRAQNAQANPHEYQVLREHGAQALLLAYREEQRSGGWPSLARQSAPPTVSSDHAEFWVPERGSPERTDLMNSIRPFAEEVFGAPVEFMVETIRVSSEQAFISVVAQRPGGTAINLRDTPGYRRGEISVDYRGEPISGDAGQVQAILQRTATGWAIAMVVYHASEAWWVGDCAEWFTVLPGACPYSGVQISAPAPAQSVPTASLDHESRLFGPHAVLDFDDSRPCQMYSDWSGFRDCLVQIGASDAVIAAARALSGEGGVSFLSDYWSLGRVDAAETVAPTAANKHWYGFILDGQRYMAAGFEREAVRDRASRNLQRRYPNAVSMSPTWISGHRYLENGGQRFILTGLVTDGCRACDVIATAIGHVDFRDGRMVESGTIGWAAQQGSFPTSAAEIRRRLYAGDVQEIQKQLNLRGYIAGAMDGAFGPNTARALREFRTEHCLGDDAEWTRETAALLAGQGGQELSAVAAPCGPGPRQGAMATAAGTARDAFPLREGIYARSADYCDLDRIDMARYGDGIGAVTRLFEGGVMHAYESACRVDEAVERNGRVRVRYTCFGEGDSWPGEALFENVSETGFTEVFENDLFLHEAAPFVFSAIRRNVGYQSFQHCDVLTAASEAPEPSGIDPSRACSRPGASLSRLEILSLFEDSALDTWENAGRYVVRTYGKYDRERDWGPSSSTTNYGGTWETFEQVYRVEDGRICSRFKDQENWTCEYVKRCDPDGADGGHRLVLLTDNDQISVTFEFQDGRSTIEVPDETVSPTSVRDPLATMRLTAGFFDSAYLASQKRQHLGADYAAPVGTPVRSPVTGTVVSNNTQHTDDPDLKRVIIRDGTSGYEHVLGHIDSDREEGATVRQGDVVGSIVSAGTGPHLHWGINRTAVSDAMGHGWGWGRAHANATRADAEARGWIDPEHHRAAASVMGTSVPDAPTDDRETPTIGPGSAVNLVDLRLAAGFLDPAYTARHGKRLLGVDLRGDAGTVVLAPISGMIMGNRTGADVPAEEKWLILRDPASGQEHVFGHILSALEPGQDVNEGDYIGVIAEGGRVHWGVNRLGIWQAIDTASGWGWGYGPAGATEAHVAERGWIDPRQLLPVPFALRSPTSAHEGTRLSSREDEMRRFSVILSGNEPPRGEPRVAFGISVDDVRYLERLGEIDAQWFEQTFLSRFEADGWLDLSRWAEDAAGGAVWLASDRDRVWHHLVPGISAERALLHEMRLFLTFFIFRSGIDTSGFEGAQHGVLQPIYLLNATRNRHQPLAMRHDRLRAEGFNLKPRRESVFHAIGKDLNRIQKWVHTDGREYVFENMGEGNFELVLDGTNNGTFNYCSERVCHLVLDVIPWLLWGATPNDTTTPEQRAAVFLSHGGPEGFARNLMIDGAEAAMNRAMYELNSYGRLQDQTTHLVGGTRRFAAQLLRHYRNGDIDVLTARAYFARTEQTSEGLLGRFPALTWAPSREASHKLWIIARLGGLALDEGTVGIDPNEVSDIRGRIGRMDGWAEPGPSVFRGPVFRLFADEIAVVFGIRSWPPMLGDDAEDAGLSAELSLIEGYFTTALGVDSEFAQGALVAAGFYSGDFAPYGPDGRHVLWTPRIEAAFRAALEYAREVGAAYDLSHLDGYYDFLEAVRDHRLRPADGSTLSREEALDRAIGILLGDPYGRTRDEVRAHITNVRHGVHEICGGAPAWIFDVHVPERPNLSGEVIEGHLVIDSRTSKLVCANLPFIH